jgi:hypothetical protein
MALILLILLLVLLFAGLGTVAPYGAGRSGL